MNALRVLAPFAAAAIASTTTTPSFGQASPSEMSGFPMPPPGGYSHTKHFAYTGDYGYFLTPASGAPGMTANAGDYRYVRYTGVAGRRTFVYAAWGTTTIGPASPRGDNCGHAHVSYGVWLKYEIRLLFGMSFSGWVFQGGGGMSGQRVGTRCVFRTDNPLSSIDPRFGWGSESKEYDFRSRTFWKEIVVGALSNTHGWGSCTMPGTFPACHEPSWVIGYTLP